MGQTVKLRRSAVSGKVPINSQLQLGELSVNTADGKLFFAKSGSFGPSIEEIITTNTQNTGSIDLVGALTASVVSSSFIGDGSELYNIPASGVVGLSLDQISSDGAVAAITAEQLDINVNTVIDGSLTATEITGSGLGLTNVPVNISGSSHTLTNYDGLFTKIHFDESTGIKVEGDSSTGIAKIYLDGVASDGGGGVGSTKFIEVTSPSSTWTFNHGLGEKYPSIMVFDSNNNVIIPQNIEAISTTQLVVSFASPQIGYVTATVGGGLPTTTVSDNKTLVTLSGVPTWKEGILSGSVSFNSFSSSIDTIIGSLETESSSIRGDFNAHTLSLNTYTSSNNSIVVDLVSETGSYQLKSNFNSYTSSISAINTTQNARIGSLEGFTASIDDTYATDSDLNAYTTSNDIRVDSIESKTGSFLIDSDLNILEGQVGSLETESGSVRSTLNTYTSSNDGRVDSLEIESGSVRTTLNTYTSSNDSRVDSIESQTGSYLIDSDLNTLEGQVGSLEIESGSVRSALNTYTSSNDSRVEELVGFKDDTEVAIELTGSNVTIKGNLLVKGTETRVNSTTVEVSDNVISLNGSGAANGGIEVRDVTSPGILSGSLIWDGTDNKWKGGVKGSEENLVLDGDFSTYRQQTDNRLGSLETSTSSLNSFTSSINTTIKSKLDTEGVISGSIQIDHDLTTNFVANEHIDHSSITIGSGKGLEGGGTIDTNRSLSLNTGSLHFLDGVKSKLNTETVVSGSVQIDITGTTNYNLVDGRLDSLESNSGSYLTEYNDEYTTGATFNSTNGVITYTRNDGDTFTVDIDGRYLTSFTETDPVFTASPSAGITDTNISNWNTAYTYSTVGHLPLSGGTMTGNITLNDSVFLRLGNDTSIYSDGADSYIQTSQGDLYFYQGGDDKDIVFLSDNGLGGVTEYFRLDGSIKRSVFSQNVGFEDNVRSLYGSGNDLQIYHDGSNSYITDSGTGNLRIRSTSLRLENTDSSNMVVANGGGSVDIYYNGSAKFSTTNTGVSVTGIITATGGNSSQWNTAHGWGDHSLEGYVTSSGNTVIGTDTDLNFSGANVLSTIALTDGVITSYTNRVLTLANLGYTGASDANKYVLPFTDNSSNWNTAYGWGDHASAGYISSFTNTNEFTTGATFNSGNGVVTFTRNNGGDTFTVDLDGRYLTSFTETDPIFTASPSAGITDTNISNWNTAYGWGDHSQEGYITSFTDTNEFTTGATFNSTTGIITFTRNNGGDTFTVDIDGKYLPLAGGTLNGALTISSASDGHLILKQTDAGSVGGTKEGGWNYMQFYDGQNDRQGYFGIDSSGHFLFNPEVSGAEVRMNRTLRVSSNIISTGTLTASGYNDSNWNTAYGWGDHSLEGYLTSYNDEYTTGVTWTAGTATLTFTRNDGDTYDVQMLETLTDVTVTGGTYASGTQILTLTKSDGSTVDVSGFAIDTDVNWYTTGATFNTGNGVITGTRSDGGTWTVDIDNRYLQLGGGTLTGNLTLNSTNPEILFNGTSDAGVDMAIKATPEGLDFYEPEDSNKIHFQILDDAGVNSLYGYKLNGTTVINQSRVLSNITGNISMFTNDSNYLTSFTETDPIFTASPSAGITNTNISNWNTAYGWGNHASVGYITGYSEVDTLDSVTDRGATTSNDITVGKLTTTWGEFTTTNNTNPGVDDLNVSGFGVLGNRNTNPIYLHNFGDGGVRIGVNTTLGNGTNGVFINDTTSTFYTDVTVTGTLTASGYNDSNWNTAYGWGDHSGVYLPIGGGTLTGDLTIDNNIPRIDFKPDSSGSNVGGRIEMNENGNLWVNAQGGKDLWLNWYSPTSPSSKADLQVGDGNEGSSILTVQGTTRRVGINKTGPTQALDVLGNIVASGTVTASGGNSGNWNTAYGWGNHASVGYITGYSEVDTLATVTSRGSSTTNDISVGDFLATHQSGDDATTKAEMLSYAVAKFRPHSTNSGTLAIAQVDGGNSVGLQFTNGAGSADWDMSLQPFGGNVGINKINPAGALHVYSGTSERFLVSGDVHVQGATDLNINGTSRRLSFTNGNGTIRTTNATELYLQTNSTTALTIDANQNVSVVGTLSASNYNNTNWDTAYGWGNHASVGYITGFTNTNEFTTGATFNSGNGIVTFTRNNGGDTFTVDLDGRYGLKSLSENKTYTSGGNSVGSYLGGHYSSGGTEKPNSSTFGAGKLKIAMLSNVNLGFGGSWNDVLWISAYNGGDVKGSHALVFDKYSANVYVSDQSYDSATWGTGYQLWHTGHFQQSSIDNWNTAYGWGDHSTQGYTGDQDLSGYLLNTTDTFVGNLEVNGMVFKDDSNVDRNFKMQTNDTGTDVGLSMYSGAGAHIIQLYGTSSGGGQYGFLDANWGAWDIRKVKNGAFEVDEGSGLKRVWNEGNLTNNQGNWDTAYGWGDHSTEGYVTGNYLPIAGGTLTGDLIVGSIAKTSNTVVKVLAEQGYKAGFEAYGNGQGTGYIYVGQSTTHGGGMSYNGDSNPALVSGETNDRITFYRRTNSVDSEVFSYNHNSDSVYFNGEILPSTINTGQGSTEVHLMNQNIRTTDSPTFATINTGQGATEVHLMNQNIRTTDDVQFGKGKFSEQVSVNNRAAISVAHWGASSNTTGAIKIKVPGTHTSNWSMFVLRITTYEYNSNAHAIYYVSGHDWTSGWYQNGVTVQGTGKTLSLGFSTGANEDYIILGDVGSTWQYGHVTVDVVVHPEFYSSSMDITEGWSITQETDLAGITINSVTNKQLLDTSNYGTKISQWDAAYGWGDHSLAGYTGDQDLTGYLLNTTDTFAGNITFNGGNNNSKESFLNVKRGSGAGLWLKFQTDSTSANNVSQFVIRRSTDNVDILSISAGSGNLSVPGTLSASGYNDSNWNTAHGWGDHSLAGYTGDQDLTGYATETYVGTQIDNLIASAPGTLDTLNELAAALGDDPSFATTITTSIATKLPLAGGVMSGNIGRSAHNKGYLVGGYNNIGASATATNPIFTIGTSYLPAVTTLGNMYGIGYTRGDASFMGIASGSGWGMYVAADGDARIWLDGSTGDIVASGTLSASGYNDSNWNTAYGWGDHASAGYISSFTNTNEFTTGATFNSGNGIITFTRNNGGDTFTVDIDGRFAPTVHNHHGTYMKTNRTLTSINTIDNGGDRYDPSADTPTNEHYAVLTYGNGGNVTGQLATHFVTGDLYSRGYNSTWSTWKKYFNTDDFTTTNVSNWNTAYGWGDHSVAGYLTSYSETDTLASVTSRGSSTTTALQINSNDFTEFRSAVDNSDAGIRFSSMTAGTQFGDFTFNHVNTASYGSLASFKITSSESSLTILADGKLMFKEGIYSKPATGTGAGTRKDSNWDTAYGWGDHASAGYTSNTGTLTDSNDRNYITDSRGAARAPSYYNDRYAQWDFQNVSDTGVGGDAWHALLTVSKWASFDASHRQEQLIFSGDHLWRRTATSDSAWGTNKKIWDSGNFNPASYLTTTGKAADSELLDGINSTSFIQENEDRRHKVIRFTGQSGDSGVSPQSYAIYQEGGAWAAPYPDLIIGMHTGIKIGGYNAYGGTRFYNDAPGIGSSTEIFSVGDGDNHVRVANNLIVGGTVTASSFSGNASTATYAADSNLLDGLDSLSFLRSDAADSFTGTITMGTQKALVANNYGRGVYGLYSSTVYQHVWSMGTAYNLSDDGSTSGNLYGLSFTHTNVGGQSKSGLDHQLLVMRNGVTVSAIGAGMWTDGTITTTSHGTSANWKSAYTYSQVGHLTSSSTLNASNMTTGTLPDVFSPNTRYNIGLMDGNSSLTRDKLRVWTDSNYVIGMKSGYGFGHLGNSEGTNTEYAMSFQMNNQEGRGFWWGGSSDNDNQGAMGLTHDGKANIKTSLSIGEGNTISPSTTPLYVEGSTAGETVFEVQGTSGQLFSITDSLIGDIFEVSDISGVPIFTVNSSGIVTVDDTLHVKGDVIAYYASDRRLKDNIKPIENSIDKIKMIGGYEFDWNSKSKNNHGHDVGVIAQEIEEVLPELVGTRGDGFKGVKYEKLTALLIQANKELIERVEELESKLKK